MKLSIVGSLVGYAVADFSQMNTDMAALLSAAGANGTVDRTISQSDMALVNEYGCWCYFEGDHGKGRGHPVDELDAHCKRLHDGYMCEIMDAEMAGDDCEPWTQVYNSAVGSGLLGNMDIEDIRHECESQNPGEGCMQWTCEVEGYFVQQVFLYFTHGGGIDMDMRHENGFDWEDGCPITQGLKSEHLCCGIYPLRFPFKSYGGSRDCCIDRTFNTAMYSCCSDGTIGINCS